MPRPADVPEHLWLSDSLIVRRGAGHGSSGSMPWAKVEGLALQMREAGDTWVVIALALVAKTGVSITPKGVQDYMARKWGA